MAHCFNWVDDYYIRSLFDDHIRMFIELDLKSSGSRKVLNLGTLHLYTLFVLESHEQSVSNPICWFKNTLAALNLF